MKIVVSKNQIFGMANLNPQRSGLGNIVIWSDHGGISRNVKHNLPRIKMTANDASLVVSIEPIPIILSKRGIDKISDARRIFKDGIDYVGRNYTTFLKHFNDTDFSFDDEDLYAELRSKGEYK